MLGPSNKSADSLSNRPARGERRHRGFVEFYKSMSDGTETDFHAAYLVVLLLLEHSVRSYINCQHSPVSQYANDERSTSQLNILGDLIKVVVAGELIEIETPPEASRHVQ